MGNEVANLIFKADTSQIEKAEKRLDELGRTAKDVDGDFDRLQRETKQTTKEIDKLGDESTQTGRKMRGLNTSANSVSKAFAALKIPIIAVGAAFTAGSIAFNRFAESIEESGAEFSILNARLVTATGSTEAAAEAFDLLNSFALETPFTLNEAVNGFAKLTNLGLNPSRDALVSYANTAAAMGASLEQMVEAVADATTGEFERLKEFGIRSSQEGDRVTFTFQGVSTTIEKEAAAIEGYLRDIGNVAFAGAAIEQTRTLAGSVSNLEQAYDLLKIAAGEAAGANEIFAETNNQVASEISDPEFQEGLARITATFAELKKEAKLAGVAVVKFFVDAFSTTTAEQIENTEARIAQTESALRRLRTRGIDESNAGFQAKSELLSQLQQDLINLQAEADTTAEKLASAGETLKKPPEEEEAVERETFDPSGIDDSFGEESPFLEAFEADITAREARFEAFRESELQRLRELEQAKLDVQKEFQDIGFEQFAQGQFNIFEFLEKAKAAELNLEELTGKQKQKLAIGVGGQLLGALASQSKKAFEVQKAFKIAETVVSTYNAATSAYASLAPIPIVGPALGAAAAAAAIAFGTAQVNAIKSTQPGGGSVSGGSISGGTSASGAAATAPVQPTQVEREPETRVVELTVNGAIDPEGTRRLAEALNEASGDGVEIRANVI